MDISETDAASILQMYRNEVENFPRLAAKEERRLGIRIRKEKDVRAEQALVEANLRLAIAVARKFRASEMEKADLVQTSNEWLLRAARQFDPTWGTRFSTFAVLVMRQGIQRTMADNRLVRIPIHKQEEAFAVLRAIRKLGKRASAGELSKETGLSEKILRNVLVDLGFSVVSLDDRMRNFHHAYTEGTSRHEMVPDRRMLGPEHIAAARDALREAERDVEATLSKAREFVSEKVFRIFRLCYGVGGARRHAYRSIGEIVGVSYERVRAARNSVWRKLATRLFPMDHERFIETIGRIERLEELLADFR